MRIRVSNWIFQVKKVFLIENTIVISDSERKCFEFTSEDMAKYYFKCLLEKGYVDLTGYQVEAY